MLDESYVFRSLVLLGMLKNIASRTIPATATKNIAAFVSFFFCVFSSSSFFNFIAFSLASICALILFLPSSNLDLKLVGAEEPEEVFF